ncbi:MAG: response regulator, partial [Lachnospiraceae bacterium]|nr:response regulator [Lachnospiraceae bacterium]
MDKENAILIVDDVDINREILAEIFCEDYHIIQAENGKQALDIMGSNPDISAVLLDLLMPEMNGLEVLKEMNRNETIKNIPVFLITAANNDEMLMEGYDLGAVDVIRKPFMMHFLKHRISNVIELYGHRNELEHIVEKQVERLQEVNQSMIETLATLIEFRDCESGEHVQRICGLTRIIMKKVSHMFPEYYMPKHEIDKVVRSAVLHDVGKIAIP